MREIKFRAWDSRLKIMCYCGLERAGGYHECMDDPLMQFTGLLDKNGLDIYEGDLLNVYFTSHEGVHIHDCVYEVQISPLTGIELIFKSLLWESLGYNQYPIDTSLCVKYKTLSEDYINQKYDRLAVCDSWGEQHLTRHRWKENDYSNFIENIGNIYEHSHLIES